MASSRNARIKSQVSPGWNDVTWSEYRYRPGTAMLAPVPNVLRISLNFRSSSLHVLLFPPDCSALALLLCSYCGFPSITSAYCLRCLPAIYRLGSSLFICHARRCPSALPNEVSVINGIKASGSRSEEQTPGTSLSAETVSLSPMSNQIAVLRWNCWDNVATAVKQRQRLTGKASRTLCPAPLRVLISDAVVSTGSSN